MEPLAGSIRCISQEILLTSVIDDSYYFALYFKVTIVNPSVFFFSFFFFCMTDSVLQFSRMLYIVGILLLRVSVFMRSHCVSKETVEIMDLEIMVPEITDVEFTAKR